MPKTEKATFAMGCFWGPQMYFDQLPGVVGTRVGYAGGTKADPTYHDLGDHTETTEVTFDPSMISFQDLLGHFWDWHDPTVEQPTQYQSAIFAQGDAQLAAAQKSLAEQQEKARRDVLTRIEPLQKFYEAEGYHQKYYEKCGLAGRMGAKT